MPTWPEDTARSYTYGMNGTSAAASMVTGALALVLEACPTLGWRDVRYLIAQTATRIDSGNASWVTNGAGLHHSIDYGFGRINPQGMIAACQQHYTPLPTATTVTRALDTDMTIPDHDSSGVTYSFTITENRTIEWLGVTLVSDHPRAGDLAIYLTSPAGTTPRLMRGDSSGWLDMRAGFRFGSVAFMGEHTAGTWTLRLVDEVSGETGKLSKVTFEAFGH